VGWPLLDEGSRFEAAIAETIGLTHGAEHRYHTVFGFLRT
jgi:hypothetical protein